MKYFKNTELAKLYHISEKSVRNWIEAAEAGKLNLQLYEEKTKFYVANTTANTQLVEQLVLKGKKFKNTRGLKTLTASKEFYKIYNKKQILDIVSNLSIHKEIPLQYGYLNSGADSWNHYTNHLAEEEAPNLLNQTTELLEVEAAYINKLSGRHKVNVVDLGPGNGQAIRSTLGRLLEEGRLNRYIAIDISQDMLAILKSNIHKWFDGKIDVEGYVRNFAEERFDDLFIEERTRTDVDSPINLVFLLGGTINNFRLPDHALRVINNSLGPNDMLIYGGYLDTQHTRRYFGPLLAKSGVRIQVPNLLNIDEELCELELVFSEGQQSRLQWLKPKVDLVIKFELDGETWNAELHKNEPVLLWRHRHYSYDGVVKLFDQNGFNVLQATKSESQDYVLLIAKIKTGIAA